MSIPCTLIPVLLLRGSLLSSCIVRLICAHQFFLQQQGPKSPGFLYQSWNSTGYHKRILSEHTPKFPLISDAAKYIFQWFAACILHFGWLYQLEISLVLLFSNLWYLGQMYMRVLQLIWSKIWWKLVLQWIGLFDRFLGK